MSNFPLGYKLSWLPRLARPSLGEPGPGAWRTLEPTRPVTPGSIRRLVFLGDISAVANTGVPVIDPRLSELLAGADLVIANCESPVVERPRSPLGTAAGTRHAMTPRFLADVLSSAGIDRDRLLLSIANNHALDQGVAGLAETKDQLGALGIATMGFAEDGLGRALDLDGLPVRFAAFTTWHNRPLREFDGRIVLAGDVAERNFEALRTVEPVFRCVVAHWDHEFRHQPHASTRLFAERLAEAGADLIVGHHAHVVQATGLIGRTPVAYGLGDFLGTALPVAPWPLRLGAVLVVLIGMGTDGNFVTTSTLVPFLRERRDKREKLVPLDMAPGPAGARARARFGAMFPAGAGVHHPTA